MNIPKVRSLCGVLALASTCFISTPSNAQALTCQQQLNDLANLNFSVANIYQQFTLGPTRASIAAIISQKLQNLAANPPMSLPVGGTPQVNCAQWETQVSQIFQQANNQLRFATQADQRYLSQLSTDLNPQLADGSYTLVSVFQNIIQQDLNVMLPLQPACPNY